jgi:tripartite-type tricarboxylate transporter receptor subunit TctC
MVKHRALRLMSFLGFFALGATGAQAQSPESFYRGRTVSIYIGFGGGGSYDFYGHLLARHMGKHIPGNPNVVAQSMPGAGSFKLANWLTSVAPKDGTAMGIVSQAVALEEALGSQGVQYKAREFNWIGRATSVIEIVMTGEKAKARTLDDAYMTEVMIGGTGPGSPSEGYPKLLNAAAGTKFRIIAGYPASAEVLLAMEKGEVDAAFTSFGSLTAYHQDWLDQKKVHLLAQGTVARSQELPDVPAVGELGKTPEDRRMLQLYASTADIGRSFIAPPGLPPERVAVLRAAFDATMNDPEFRAEVARVKAEFHPLPGAEVQKLIEATAQTPPEIIARMKGLLQATK